VKQVKEERGEGKGVSVREIFVANRQRKVRFDLPWLRRFAEVAFLACLPECGDGRHALRALPEIDVAIVSDRTIARVHRQFMNVPGATDVITFEHGELVISVETARAYAQEYAQTLEHELGLYIIHGLLHLNGYDDIQPADHTRMHQVQNRVMKTCLVRLAAT
jgi:probable rRNA maturation factor